MSIQAKNHVAELLAELRAIEFEELGRIFISRDRDSDFALIGAMSISRTAPRHILVFEGFNLVRQNRYAGQ